MIPRHTVAQFERLYIRSVQAPFRQFLITLFAFAIGLWLLLPLPYIVATLAVVILWDAYVGPLLSSSLPFSPEIRDFWRQRREQRGKPGKYTSGFAELVSTTGIGLIGAGLVARLISSHASVPLILPIGIALTITGTGTALASNVVRRVSNRRNG